MGRNESGVWSQPEEAFTPSIPFMHLFIQICFQTYHREDQVLQSPDVTRTNLQTSIIISQGVIIAPIVECLVYVRCHA